MNLKATTAIVVLLAITVTSADEFNWLNSGENFLRDLVRLKRQNSAQNDTEVGDDEILNFILDSGRQGRSLEGFDEVYSDPSVQQALQNSDDVEARNIIKEKLCALGLMQCDGELIDGRRPYLNPNNLIYAQPVALKPVGRPIATIPVRGPPPPPGPGPHYSQKPPQYKPHQGPYGPPQPMPVPNRLQQKVGFASQQPSFNGPNSFSSSSSYTGSYSSQSGSFPPYASKPPGPIYDGGEGIPYEFETPNKPSQVVIGGGPTVIKPAAEQHIHHHYHHIEGEKAEKTVIVNNPIPLNTGVLTGSVVGGSSSSSNSLYSSGVYGTSGISSGGFSPSSSKDFDYHDLKGANSNGYGLYGANGGKDFDYQDVRGGNSNGYGQSGSYASQSKPISSGIYNQGPATFGSSDNIVYGSNSAGSSGSSGSNTNYNGLSASYNVPSSNNQYNSASSNYNYNGQSTQGGFHASNPNLYKKELNVNGLNNNGLGNYNKYSQQYNGQYSNNFNQEQFGSNGQYGGSGFNSRAEDCVCVPYEQCPAQDVVGRRDDLILPLDPRNLKSDIQADSEQVVVTDGNGTMTVVNVAKDASSNTATGKKVTKREASASGKTDKSDDKANIEPRQANYGPRPQQCPSRHVCCRRPVYRPQPANLGKCGARNAQGINGRIKNPVYVDGDSEFGEYPWQVAILKKDPKESVYVCGGTLIDNRYIVTAAHCVKTYNGFDLRVRLGEWDVNHDVEFYPYIERDVVAVQVHPEYYAGTLENDIAILKMDIPVDFSNTPHISPACLPEKHTDFSGQRCWTTGWGKDAFGDYGKYQNILKEVDVPIINDYQCQNQLRQTRLGYSYKLNPGFICAGGEEGKDACKGDGGGPLVCDRNGSWQVVGIVSWGIGCGKANVPGVYVKVSHYMNWINQVRGKF
ncbi:uncharacterized protein LOC129770626 isoform X3 [Toxorhynchites rutilus septentrionalis]|uniref:uncharacterized protein LOC129770626 isoform X3 n=1 Tax=Toxorhynchites rutilus septentrionalis TaxID=329112 RepID=UPI00247A421D|nr:uncharacterized protein LOC129770626 isoform X3 [Toxorhynchites rutilus septentrionalis]